MCRKPSLQTAERPLFQQNLIQFCKDGIKHFTGLPHSHKTTGLVDRTIQTLKNYIKASEGAAKSLTEGLRLVLRPMRISINPKNSRSRYTSVATRDKNSTIYSATPVKLLIGENQKLFWSNSPLANPMDSYMTSDKKTAAAVKRTKSLEIPLSAGSRASNLCYVKS